MPIFKSKFPDVVIPEESIFQHVLVPASKFGDKIALIDYTTKFSLTYSQLGKLSFCVSKNLREKFGFNKGDVFAVYLPNHPMYAVFMFGAQSTGAACTTINPLYTADELRKQLKDSNARALVTIPMFVDKAVEAAKGETQIKTIFVLNKDPVETKEDSGITICDSKLLLAPPTNAEPVKVEIDPKNDVCVIPYSSGTTGNFKGVVLTHHNLVSNVVQTDCVETVNDQDTIVGVLPFFHIYGMVLLVYKALKHGVTIVTMPKFEFVDFLKIVQEYKVTKCHLAPPIILALAKHPVVDQFDLSSMKYIVSGAAPLSGDLQKAASARLKANIRQGYGMTELSPVVTVQKIEDALDNVGSAGVLISNTEMKIVDTATGEEKDVGQEGELTFRGPQVMKCYLNNEEATKATIGADGFLHTGDVGYVDANGNIFIVDRVKELIKYKGYQVAPAELEGVLLKHDSIADAAVIGVPDEEVGENPKAYVVLKANHNLTEDEVKDFVASKVAPYKKLRFVEFIDVIPKSASGKILRKNLKLREKEKAMAKQ